MGIRDLWPTLTPVCEKKSLYALDGKAVAIDLACWVVGAKTVAGGRPVQSNPGQHLSQVFFRTAQLLALNVYPVFVLEGKAPTLKYDTIAARNLQQRQQNNEVDNEKKVASKDRTRFNAVLKQVYDYFSRCAEMLKFMGLRCVTATGEAEAMCAFLNSRKMVDAVISQDSDCFAYGARVVYRNFSINKNECFVFDMKAIEEKLGLGRNKIAVMAIFLGSDYSAGINQVGKQSLLQFFEQFTDDEVIDRVRSWRTNAAYFREASSNVLFDKELGKRMKNELQLRKKTLQEDPNFPPEDILNEYLINKDSIELLDLTWRQPNLISITKFVSKHLRWEEIYIFKKFLPIMTLWQLKNYQIIRKKIAQNKQSELKGILFPKSIIKNQTLKGVRCYQVIWEDPDKCFHGLIPQTELEEAGDALWTTSENAEMMVQAYPDLVEAFEGQKKKPKTVKNKKKVEVPTLDFYIPKTTKNKKRVEVPTHPTLDSYMPKTKVSKLKAAASEAADLSFDPNCSGFSDGDDANISLVVDRIVTRSPKILKGIRKKREERDSPPRELDYNDVIFESNREFMSELNQSSSSSTVAPPPPPTPPNTCDDDSSGDDTIICDPDPDELEILNEIHGIKTETENQLNDTFDLDKPFIPLIDRIKKK